MTRGERGLSEFIGRVRCRNAGGSLFQRSRTVKAKEQLENLSGEMTEGQSGVKVEEECIERGGWIVSSLPR